MQATSSAVSNNEIMEEMHQNKKMNFNILYSNKYLLLKSGIYIFTKVQYSTWNAPKCYTVC